MKNVFDVILMIWLSFIFIFCMVVFSEEVFIRQQTIHIRNKVNEIIEINSGYTTNAESELNNIMSNIKYSYKIDVSKKGKLSYGDKITYKVTLYYVRKLPFLDQQQNVAYTINGEYYHASY